jgi:hypothetical protein
MQRDRRAIALWAALLFGAALRTWQYVAAGSLWLDEVALARAILEPDFGALLTRPLPYAQVAPKGFLAVEKAFTGMLGAGDHALRLFPFLASLGALLAFRSLALRVLDGAAAVVAMLLFALAPCLISYGASLKQYSSDVCIAVLLLWLGVSLAERPPAGLRSAGAAAAGAVAAWFSQPALLVLAALGLGLLWIARTQPGGTLRGWLPVGLAWTASAAAAAWVSLSSVEPDVMAFQARFWKEGYPPVPFAGPQDLLWPLERLASLYGGSNAASLGYPVRALFLALTGLGAFALWRSRRQAAVLLAGPLFAALAAAWLRLYPFSGRLILFLVPVLVLALAAGIAWLRERAAARAPWLGHALAAALVLLAVAPVAQRPPPYAREDLAPGGAPPRGHPPPRAAH